MDSEPKLDKALHIKYFQRCLKSLLPTAYTDNDSIRVALAYFILSALDLLGAGADTFPEEEKEMIKEWFLSCQCEGGGFCGNPGLRFDSERDDMNRDGAERGGGREGKLWLDGASVPMTYFALLGLATVEGLEEVRREECLRWLRGLQRTDVVEGEYGDVIGGFGESRGLRKGDMRIGYCGGVVRWILGGGEGWTEEEEEDINVEGFVRYLRAGQVCF